MSFKQKFLFAGVLLLAIFFRFYLITQMPGGLFPDEAANGIDINSMQQGQLQPFYERGNGREALFFYMLWGSVEVFDKGPWQHHIVSALVGVLAVVLCYFVTYRLFMLGKDPADERSRRRAATIALLAMLFMAVSTWHTVLSRTAFRANLIPLFASLSVFFLLCVHQARSLKTRLWFAFLCGASFALGFYTYIAYRILVPILAVALFWPLVGTLRTREFWGKIKKYFLPAVLFLVAFAIFIYPLAQYFYQHQDAFIGRSGQVSVFNQTLYLVDGQQLSHEPQILTVLNVMLEVGKQSLRAYFIEGDLNWRHNISGFPFLSQLVSPFFGIGLVLSLFFAVWYFFAPNKRAGYWKFFLLSGWFWGMLLPVVTTAEGIPHGLRAIGTIPAVFIMSAWAVYEFAIRMYGLHRKIWDRCFCYENHGAIAHPDRHSKYFAPFKLHIVEKALKAVVVVFVAALVLQSYVMYFVYAYNSPENFYAFRSDLTVVSDYLEKRCNKEQTYLVLDKFSVQTTDYMTSDWHGNFSDRCNVPYQQVDPERVHLLPKLKPGDEVVFTQSSIFDTKKFKLYHQDTYLAKEVRNKFDQAVMAVYKQK